SRERIKHAGKWGQHGGNRPDEPFSGGSGPQYDAASDNAERNSEHEQQQQERNCNHSVREERKTEDGGCHHQHYEEPDGTSRNGSQDEAADILRDAKWSGEEVQEIA